MRPRKRGDWRWPDMPKRQPCPQCSKNCKRVDKTMGGANYYCSTHGKFFVTSGG